MTLSQKKKLLGTIVTLAVMSVLYGLQSAGLLILPEEDTSTTDEHSPQQEVIADGTVTHVVDGDTLDVMLNGKEQRVRLLGINTPETVDPRKEVECFGKEASAELKRLAEGKKITLQADASQGDADKYGRLLRYVFLEDGTNVNLVLLQHGFAYEYTYQKPYELQTEFKAAQEEAEQMEAGLWGVGCES